MIATMMKKQNYSGNYFFFAGAHCNYLRFVFTIDQLTVFHVGALFLFPHWFLGSWFFQMCFLHAAGLGTGFGTGFGLRMGFGLRTLAIDGKQPLLRPILALGTLSLVRTLPGITSCGHSMAFASGFSLAFCKAFRLCFQHLGQRFGNFSLRRKS